MKSREGVSVTHYPEHFKKEVVAYAKATSQKDAKDRFNLPESTVRMWLMKSDGLEYRGSSYSRSSIEKVPFQGRLQDFLADAPEDINIEAGPSKAAEMTGPLKPRHAEFLQTIMAEYRGEKLTKVLEHVKTLPEEVLDKLAKEGGHKEVFEAEFHFEQDEIERKAKKKPRRKKPKKSEAEELEFKPNVKEMLKNVKPASSDTEEKNEESTLSEVKKLEKPPKEEQVKLEEDEVKM